MNLHFALLFSLLFTSLHGQEESKRTVVIRTAALGVINEESEMWVRTGTGQEAISLALNSRTFSQPVKISIEGGRLGIWADKNLAQAVEPPPPTITAQLASEKSLLIFLPDKETYRVLSFPDSEIPPGAYVLINLSPQPLVWSFDEKRPVILKPGERAVYPASPGVSTKVKIGMNQPDGSVRLIRNSMWQLGATQREFVMIYGSPEKPLFHHLVDALGSSAAP